MRVIVMVFSMVLGAVLVGLLLMATLFLAGAAHASENVPALLRYAQQYDAERKGRGDALASPSTASRQSVQELQRRQLSARVKVLSAQLAEKDKQLAALREKQRALTDDGQVQVQLKTLNTQLAEKDKQLTALRDKQQASVEASQTKVSALSAQLAEKDKQLSEKAALLTALQDKQQVAMTAEAERVKTLTADLAEKDKQLAALAKRVPAPVTLDTAAARQAYATGVLFGRDVDDARKANQQMGLKLDDALLLAGVSDALSGQPKMDEEALAKAQEEARKAAEKALVVTVAAQKKADAAWVGRFAKQKGVVKAPEGYWYKVEHDGDGARLTENDTVALVVTETMTNGTVVSDMEGAGGTLMETVSALPPAFAGALVAVKNHGSLTLVVPPELAYGDKGYPPKVPPGATMVYKLRVADVVEAPGEKTKKQ
ncbi:hypothetical protein FOT43_22575 [Serratia marcescens]|uniref:FKBP-type peptidyl-prolyl cis-trans isomerase N-terminal domain-containing protein n=1 Tax=Serratia marcescens TaxID=615 RepID=UPI0011803C3B|nr:FKBP-type peptidyl-prolyl cis-trans isomerase N-terminal domain-containing protein [Serratia marcescens]TSB25744.1 hypothetical protein FOT43_22575 [Serratia marcescens]TXE43917.1 hypothetical protein FOT60_12565 [Serratia marcescens]